MSGQQPCSPWVGISLQTPPLFGETRRGASWINSERVSNRDGGFRQTLKLRSAIGFDGPGASGTPTREVGGVLRVQRGGRHDCGGIAQGRVRAIVPPWGDDGREDPRPEA